MPDVFTIAKRSEVMSRIRSKENKDTELKLASLFRQSAIKGWRRNQRLLGRPDFVFRTSKVAVFVDGCFWHGCPRCYRPPRSNLEYWNAKHMRNRKRDRIVTKELRRMGWTVVRVWEHELRSPKRILDQIINLI